jgi:hypothetical protein
MESPQRRTPIRTTVGLPTRIAPSSLQRAQFDARRFGFKTLRAYLEALIKQGLVDDEHGGDGRLGQFASAEPALLPTLIGHRTVRALEALSDRIDAGDDVALLEADLRALRRDVAVTLSKLHAAYEREVDARDERLLSEDL